MNFLFHASERRVGFDLNGDGYIAGEERKTHIDFNGDNIIGRLPDVSYGYPAMYGGGYGGYSSLGYGGYGYGYGTSPFGFF